MRILLIGMLLSGLILSAIVTPAPLVSNEPFTGDNFGLRAIELQVSSSGLWKLRKRRDEAIQIGILVKDKSDWVTATLAEGAVSVPVEMRLKGDWSDHLKGSKWSFRIRTNGKDAWNGLRVFSVQDPATRNFLWEWLFHRLLMQLNVLTTRYDFLKLSLNGKYLGVFAIEEHFSDELLESQSRILAPILKFDESAVWQARLREQQTGKFIVQDLPLNQAAEIIPFESRESGSPKFKAWVDEARTLLNQYRYGYRPYPEFMDMEKMAIQFAVCDLFGSYHSLVWHNQRFYFNPVSQNIEPVVFDGFQGGESNATDGFAGWNGIRPIQPELLPQDASHRFWEEPLFVRHYYRVLKMISAPDFLESFFRNAEPEMQERRRLLRTEYPFLLEGKEIFLKRAAGIHNRLIAVNNILPQDGQFRNSNSVIMEVFENDRPTGRLLFPNEILSANPGQELVFTGSDF